MFNTAIRFRHLQCFLTIAQLRKVSRAANALAITQPALSKTLRELESILKVRLFHRSAQGMALTNFGRLFLQHATASVTSLRHGVDSIRAARADGSTGLSIGVLPNVAPKVIPLAIERFRRKFPTLAIRFVGGPYPHLLDLLRLGELEMVVGRLGQPEIMRDLTFEHLYFERLSAFVRLGHPLASVRKVKPDMFGGYPWVLPLEDTIIGHEIRRYLIDRGVASSPGAVESTLPDLGRGYTRHSDAIWFFPRGAAELDVEDGALVELVVDAAALVGPVGITTRADATLPPAAVAMIDALRRVSRSRPSPRDNRMDMAGRRGAGAARRRAPRTSR